MKIYYIFLILLLAACYKNEPAPEPKEYFNCYIDGKYWTYKQGSFTNHDALRARVNAITLPGFEITADDVTTFPQTQINIWFIQENFPTKDTVELTTYNDGYYAEILGPDTTGALIGFETDDTHTGHLIFTKREPNLIQGTFYFDAYSAAQNRTVHITNGKFSIIPE